MSTADVTFYCDTYGWPEQREGEPEQEFRCRVADQLRARGQIVEAQEVLTGRRWDDPDAPPLGSPGSPLTGVLGFLAQRYEGIEYGAPAGRRAETDSIAGTVALALGSPDSPAGGMHRKPPIKEERP